MRSISRTFCSRPYSLIALWFVPLTLILLAGGCATPADKFDTLERSLRGYEKAVRWGKFDMAYTFYRWEDGQQPVIPEYLKGVRVTRYDINSRDFNSKAMTTKQVVTIYYYHMDTQREHSLTDTQDWEYDKEKRRWFIISKPPVYK